VLGTGFALPGEPVTTETLIAAMEERFGVTCGREARLLATRLDITTRHICRDFIASGEVARDGDSNADLAARAVTQALADAGLNIGDIGYLIGHSATPTQPLPPNIALVADRLGYAGPHIEIRQACTGFANALMIATGLLLAPGARPVVIVGSETGSLFFDPHRMAFDRGQIVNMVQMGDGAAAIILGPSHGKRAEIAAAWMGSNGLDRAPGIQRHHGAHEFDHDFAGILKSGPALFDAGRAVAARLGYSVGSAALIIPHQVSGRVGDMAAARLAVARDRIFVNADRVGNTGSAAIWLALAQLRAGGIDSGNTIVALGAEASKYMYGGFAYVHG
jgi:3-oxoacyl-[acyl-carrier-protein] synthase-3